ncbi:MAG: hypothetical protein HN348_11485, partial [Proteobacteria bacterium]|nr:hypothetical protein [Pseudomonadota bacterium]
TGSHTVDTNTQLSNAQVDAYVVNGALSLAAGTTLNGATISTGSHTVDTNTQLSNAQVDAYVVNGALSLAAGTTLNGATISTGSHTVDTNTQLSNAQVDAYVVNAPIGLAAGSTIGGEGIHRGIVYTHWGQVACPGSATTMYAGWIMGGHYTQGGGIASWQCMHESPNFREYNDANHDGALLYFTEFEMQPAVNGVAMLENRNDYEARCSRCYEPNRNVEFVMWGRDDCPSGWNIEYQGFIMADRHLHPRNSEAICVNRNPEIHGENLNHNGALLYTTEIECSGSNIDCQNYVYNREVVCAVCSK